MTDPASASVHGTRRRNRVLLIVIVVLFFGGLLLAGALRFSGWQPSHLVNKGELLQPYGDLRSVTLTRANGSAYDWQHDGERIWRVIVPAERCGNACAPLATRVDRVWRLLGHNADQVQILWVGVYPVGAPKPDTLRLLAPSPALLAALPRHADAKGVPVYVMDPNGFVILRYAPDSEPGDLRADLAKLLRLM